LIHHFELCLTVSIYKSSPGDQNVLHGVNEDSNSLGLELAFSFEQELNSTTFDLFFDLEFHLELAVVESKSGHTWFE